MEKKCEQCEKFFEKPYSCGLPEWSRRKYCSKQCADKARKGTPAWNKGIELHYEVWNKDKKGLQEAWNKGNGEYAKKLGFGKWMAGRFGEEANQWKGDAVGYGALHDWVRRKLGTPKKCEKCGFESSNGRRFHWANKSHQYKRELNDWMRLCAKCHKEYDRGKKQTKF